MAVCEAMTDLTHIQAIATRIVYKLVKAGYIAYFAGGWVRDYLMDHPSDDIDIATDAPPEVILDLFPRTILVGLSFGVIVVVEDSHQFEVASFRRDVAYINGRSPTHIEPSTPEEDATRRDFTINGMFYDPLEDEIYDYVGGVRDIEHKVIRAIGNPYERFVEDRLRMIRAIRFAFRFDFVIEQETKEAIIACAPMLFPAVAMERIWHEFSKMAKYPRFGEALLEMHRLTLLEEIFPKLKHLHLNDLKAHVKPFNHYPKKTPTILHLMALFPTMQRGSGLELCSYLKTSTSHGTLAELLLRLRQLTLQEWKENKIDLVEWVHLYANPDTWLCLQVQAAHLEEQEIPLSIAQFLSHHQTRIKRYQTHIERIIHKKPLMAASILQEMGITPGKKMGLLLKNAERTAILNEIDDLKVLTSLLKERGEI